MKKFAIILSLLVSSVCAVAQKPVAELPRVRVNTGFNLPAKGKTWAAHTSAQLSNALASSAPGDVIVLDAGATYAGNFTLPVKANPNHRWIYITSSAYANLPAPGTQVSPSNAANMPKIVTYGVATPLSIAGGANYWRLVGLELTSASTQGCSPTNNCYSWTLIDTPTATGAAFADSITVDRCYLHGSPTIDLQRAVVANATNFAVVGSYIGDIHFWNADSQAIIAYNTPGPLKVVNNYLEGAGENILIGGAGGHANPYVPSDIVVFGNYLGKPLSWVTPSLTGKMVVKNAFEVKSGQRILFDQNTIENVWKAGQNGFAVVLTVRSSQSGDVSVVNDITVTNNVAKNVTAFVNALAADDQCANSTYYLCGNAGSQARWNISNNLVTFYDPKIAGGGNNDLISLNQGYDEINGKFGVIHDVLVQHNTTVAAPSSPCWNSVFFSAAAAPPFTGITDNVWILDNVLCRQPFGDWGQQGTAGLTQYMGTPSVAPYDLAARFYGNVLYAAPGDKVQTFPAHNYVTTVPAAFDADYSLITPPGFIDTSDGAVAGINPYAFLSHRPPVLSPAQVAQIQSDLTQISASTQAVINDGVVVVSDQNAVATDQAAATSSQAAMAAAQAAYNAAQTALANAQAALTIDSLALNTDTATLATDQATLDSQQSAYQTFLTTLCVSQDGHVYAVGFNNGTPVCVLIN